MSLADQNSPTWVHDLRRKASESDKSWGVAIMLAVFLGMFGAERFYLGSVALGLIKLCTFGGVGLWWLADIFLLLAGRMKDSDGGVLKGPFR